MYQQTGHPSEWLRHLRQSEQSMRREIHGAAAMEAFAEALTASLTGTQSLSRSAQAGSPDVLSQWASRLASSLAAVLRRPGRVVGSQSSVR